MAAIIKQERSTTNRERINREPENETPNSEKEELIAGRSLSPERPWGRPPIPLASAADCEYISAGFSQHNFKFYHFGQRARLYQHA